MVIPVLLTQGKKNYCYQMCMKVVVGIKVSFIDEMWQLVVCAVKSCTIYNIQHCK